MSMMSERNKIDKLIGKFDVKIQNKVIERINNFKQFAKIECIDDDAIEYIVYNEMEKVMKELPADEISKLNKKSIEYGFLKGIGISIILFVLIMLFSTNVKAEPVPTVQEEIAQYIDLKQCDIHDRFWYTVCWNNKLNLATSGWTIISSDNIDKINIEKRPNFYKDNFVKTLSPTQIKLPNHNGHTFANDSDNDYNIEALKSTYNMINITAMHGTVNTGAWRKVENRGKELARSLGDIISITKVEWYDEPKYGIPYPKAFTRIYVTEDEPECYRVENIDRKSTFLKNYQVDCKNLILGVDK